MAELFGYTPTQSIVDPSSTFVQKTPNVQASRAFDSLNNLLDTAVAEKTRQVQRERSELQEKRQLLNEIQRKKAEMVSARNKFLDDKEAADKELAKQKEDAEVTNFNDSMTEWYTKYTNEYNTAGDNSELQYNSTVMFNTTIKSAYEALSEGARNRLSTSVNSKLQGNVERLAKAQIANEKVALFADMRSNMQSVMELPLEDQKKQYKRYQERATLIGVPLKELGERYVEEQGELLKAFVSKYENDLINSYDVTAIDRVMEVVDDLDEVDGRNKETITKLRDRFNGIYDSVNNHALSVLGKFATDGDKENFDLQLAIVQDIGRTDTATLITHVNDFNRVYFSEGKVAQRQLDNLVAQHNGMFVIGGSKQSDKLKNLSKNYVTSRIEEEGMTGNIDRAFWKYQSDYNPTQFKAGYTRVVTTALGNISTVAEQLQSAKTEEERVQIRGQLFGLVNGLNNLRNFGFGQQDDTQMKQAKTLEIMVTSSLVKNIPEAMKQLSRGVAPEILPLTDKGVRELRDELPDSFKEAREMYSILTGLGVGIPTEAAKETVLAHYSMQSVDGNKAKYSGAALNMISSNGTGQDTLEHFEEYLPDILENFPNGSDSLKANMKAVAPELRKVFEGENVRAVVEDGVLKYSNDNGAVVRVPLAGQVGKDVAELMLTRYLDENPVEGWERLGIDGGAVVSRVIADKMRAPVAITQSASQAVKSPTVNVYLAARTAKDAGVSLVKNLGKYIDEMINTDFDAEERGAHFVANFRKDMAPTIKDNLATHAEMDKAFDEAAEEAVAAMNEVDILGNIDSAMEWASQNEYSEALGKKIYEAASKAVDAVFKAIIPEAEGADVVPTGDTFEIKWGNFTSTITKADGETESETKVLNALLIKEAPKDRILTEGYYHQGAEGTRGGTDALTTNYGVRLDLFPKSSETETDRAHALRVYKTKFKPFVNWLGINGVSEETLAPIVWNTGTAKSGKDKSPLIAFRNKDFKKPEDVKAAFGALLGNNKSKDDGEPRWNYGLLRSRMFSWNEIATQAIPEKEITHYKIHRVNKTTTHFIMYFKDGKTRTMLSNKPLHSSNRVGKKKDGKATFDYEVKMSLK